MPISVSGNFDRYGQSYNVTQVIDSTARLNETAYEAYSPLFMSTTYATVYGTSLCLATSSIIHTVLYNGKEIMMKFRSIKTEEEDVHMKLMRNYPEVPDWWYWLVFVLFTALAIVAIEVSPITIMN